MFILGSKKPAALKRNGLPWLALYVDIKNSPSPTATSLLIIKLWKVRRQGLLSKTLYLYHNTRSLKRYELRLPRPWCRSSGWWRFFPQKPHISIIPPIERGWRSWPASLSNYVTEIMAIIFTGHIVNPYIFIITCNPAIDSPAVSGFPFLKHPLS